jgi:hypothetical protein
VHLAKFYIFPQSNSKVVEVNDDEIAGCYNNVDFVVYNSDLQNLEGEHVFYGLIILLSFSKSFAKPSVFSRSISAIDDSENSKMSRLRKYLCKKAVRSLFGFMCFLTMLMLILGYLTDLRYALHIIALDLLFVVAVFIRAITVKHTHAVLKQSMVHNDLSADVVDRLLELAKIFEGVELNAQIIEKQLLITISKVDNVNPWYNHSLFEECSFKQESINVYTKINLIFKTIDLLNTKIESNSM